VTVGSGVGDGVAVRVGVDTGVRVGVAVEDDESVDPQPASPERQAPAAARNARRSIAAGETVRGIRAVVTLASPGRRSSDSGP
jgi:hypothetical protein